jgi:hypothetical protein
VTTISAVSAGLAADTFLASSSTDVSSASELITGCRTSGLWTISVYDFTWLRAYCELGYSWLD